MHFLYVFILQFLYNSTCFELPFCSSAGIHDWLYLQLCTNHANVSNHSVLWFELVWVTYSSNCKTEQLDTFAWFVQSCRYSKSWTPDDEWNGLSKLVELYKNCRIDTYSKCILLVCLYNWLQCMLHAMSTCHWVVGFWHSEGTLWCDNVLHQSSLPNRPPWKPRDVM